MEKHSITFNIYTVVCLVDEKIVRIFFYPFDLFRKHASFHCFYMVSTVQANFFQTGRSYM